MVVTLFCHTFFFFSLTTDLYFLVPAVAAQIFIPTVEHTIITGTLTNDANAEIEKRPLTAETKTRKCSR